MINHNVNVRYLNIPGKGWTDKNVTYYKSTQPLLMNDAWRRKNGQYNSETGPYCVVARMGKIKFSSPIYVTQFYRFNIEN